MLEVKEWTVEENIENEKASEYLRRVLSLSERKMTIILKYHLCGINQNVITEDSTVSYGDVISCTIPDRRPDHNKPYEYPLDILYEDSSIAVINKPNDMAVIPGPGNWKENVDLALLNYYGKDTYYRIAHRLDKCTTGCLLITKNKKATKAFARQILDRTCHREYLAIVKGNILCSGQIELPIGRDPQNFRRMGICEDGRYALTEYEPLEQLNDAAELKVHIRTGRTHQIRVHLSATGHSLIGDDLYGEAFEAIDTKGAVLHARCIQFIHPETGEPMKIEAPVPEYYSEVKKLLSGSHQSLKKTAPPDNDDPII